MTIAIGGSVTAESSKARIRAGPVCRLSHRKWKETKQKSLLPSSELLQLIQSRSTLAASLRRHLLILGHL